MDIISISSSIDKEIRDAMHLFDFGTTENGKPDAEKHVQNTLESAPAQEPTEPKTQEKNPYSVTPPSAPNVFPLQPQREVDVEAQTSLWISLDGEVKKTNNEARDSVWFKAPTIASDASNEIVKYNERCRDIIKEENNLINHRMSWFLQFQGFLFLSASGFVTKADPIFRIILALPGLLSGCSILMVINDAEKAISRMATNMKTILEENREAMPYYPVLGLAKEKENECCLWRCLHPKSWLVLLIIFAWFGLLVYSIIIIWLELERDDWRYLFMKSISFDSRTSVICGSIRGKFIFVSTTLYNS